MFAHFPNSIGVANLRRFFGALATPPRWLTEQEGGQGFAEVAQLLLAACNPGDTAIRLPAS